MVDGLAKKIEGKLWDERSEKEKLEIYIGVVIFVLVLAIIAILATPHTNNSLQRCKNIVLQGSKYSCFYLLATSTRNGSVCSYTSPPFSDYCYNSVASLTLNASECSRISNYNGTYQCVLGIANRTDSYAACESLNGAFASYCLEAIAAKLDNATICGKIMEPNEAEICYSGIYMGDSRKYGNASYCSSVSNSTNQNMVGRIVSLSQSVPAQGSAVSPAPALGPGVLSPAEYLQTSGEAYSSRDLCYIAAVSASGNSSSCGMVQNSTLRNICQSYGSSKEPQSNATINTTSLGGFCAQYKGSNLTSCNALISISEAVINKNVTTCAGIANVSYQYQCYTSLAHAYNDSSYCGYITNATSNQACVQDIYYNTT